MLRLRSPHLVAVEDLIVDGEHLAIVMELVPGPSLRRLLEQRSSLPASEALLIVQQVLLGLSMVHAHGVVHRDVKPENVLFVGDPSDDTFQAKVTDFGIARLIGGPALTEEASLLGTPHYTAPELAKAEIPTPAVDVYAAGVLLYELLSGRTPFAGLPPMAVIQRQLTQDPPRPAQLADPVWHLLARWLQRDPARRPADAQVALDELGGVLHLVAGRGYQPLATPVTASAAGASGVGREDSVPADGLQVIHQAAEQPGTRELVGPPTQLRDPNPPAGSPPPAGGPAFAGRPPFDFGPPSAGGPPAGGPPPGSHGAQPGPQPRRRRGLTGLSKRIQVAAVAGIVVLAGVGTGMVLTSGSTPEREVSFPQENYPDSAVRVDRTWVLKLGDKPVLEGTLTIHRGTKTITIDEVLPKGLDGHIDSDASQTSTKDGHVLRYEVPAGRGKVQVVKYEVDIAKQVATQAAVQAYAVQQITATGDNYRSQHVLTRVQLQPPEYTVAPGGTGQVQLWAWTGNTLAPSFATYGAQFNPLKRDLITIGPNGVFVGNRSGSTPVTAAVTVKDGKRLMATGKVTVLEAQVGKPDTGSATSDDPAVGLAGLPAPEETTSGSDPTTRPSTGKTPAGGSSSVPGSDPGTSAPTDEGSDPPVTEPAPVVSGTPPTGPDTTAPEGTPTAEPTTPGPEPTETVTETPSPETTDSAQPVPTDTSTPETTEPGTVTPPDDPGTTNTGDPNPPVSDVPTTDPTGGGDTTTSGGESLPTTAPTTDAVTTETPVTP